MDAVRLVVVSAGLRQPSSTRLLADRLAAAAERELRQQGRDVHVRVLELRDYAVDIANNLVTGFPNPALGDALKAVESADGLIVVSPIFSASYSGLFKSFFDLIDPRALTGTPVVIAATGGSARHSLALEHALRPLFSYLHATVVPTAVYAATEDWGGEAAEFVGRIDRAAGELSALLANRESKWQDTDVEVEDDDDVIPFERLLAG
ncbi:FMN reductase [Actinospica sp.]|jgi:FMN reductase|uniref:FMN reductase n=1 Tax=Actinospica sp. TaxID=1872142 RepID=UPI002CD651B7|nr:FMN reductase [Actinospica sp.]HWG25238.1 FMN reductase [Actinospica sp.]